MKKLFKWLASLRQRQHPLWLFYENISAIFGWTMMPTLILAVFWNPVASTVNWPTFLFEYNEYLVTYAVTSFFWIKKFDWIKYRITKDPRDELFRKWFSFRYAGIYKPDELAYTPDGFDGDSTKLIRAKCSKCGVTHLFAPDEKEPRQCPYTTNYTRCNGVVEPPSGNLAYESTARTSELSKPDENRKSKKGWVYLLVYIFVFLFFKSLRLWKFLFGEDREDK